MTCNFRQAIAYHKQKKQLFFSAYSRAIIKMCILLGCLLQLTSSRKQRFLQLIVLKAITRILTLWAIYISIVQPFNCFAQKPADDVELPNKVFEQADYMARNSQYAAAESSYTHILNTVDNDVIRIKTCIRLSDIYFMTGNADKTLYYTDLALSIPSVRDSANFMFRINNIVAWVYLAKNQIAKCDSILKISAQQINEVTDREALAKYFYVTGKYAFAANDYITGLKVLQLATTQYSSEIITPEYGRVLLLIAQMFQLKNDFNLAQKNAEEALTIFKRKNFGVSQIDAYCTLGNIFLQKNDMEKAFEYYMKAKSISDTLQARRANETANLHLAIWYLKQNDIDAALRHAQAMTNINPNSTATDVAFNAAIQFGEYYIAQDNIVLAKQYADKASQLCSNSQSWQKLIDLNKLYGKIFQKENKFRKATEHLALANIYNDSLALNMRRIDIDSLGMQQELKRQRDFINLLTNENNQKDSAIEGNTTLINQQKSSIFALIGIFMIGGILTFMLAWSFLQKTKDNKALEQTNKKIAQQKEEIESQKENLLKYTKEIERMSRIASESDNAIRVFDNEGKTIWVNPGYSRMYGYTIEELNQDESLGLSKKTPIDIRKIIKTWDYEKQSIGLEAEIRNKWNIKLWVQTTLSPIYDDDNMEINQIIAIDTNITPLKKAQQDIVSMNEEITASITYAKHIQDAMLSPIDVLTTHYPNSFCYYKPRSIVSGDFYWMSEYNGRIIVACADSTGHGVPGAFLSLIGISFLSKIVNERGIVQPAIILNRLRNNVISHLHQAQSELQAGDGMDMSIISIDKHNNIMEFAGAMNPMYIIREGKIIELKPDRMPVGYYDNEVRSFSPSKVELKPNDQLYMFSDGYYDQFGGTDGLKMKTQKFKEILLDCCHKSNEEQIEILDNEFANWKGKHAQVDDILIMGIQIA